MENTGRSAIDAVASFVGSYSLALLITNRVYKEGKYTTKKQLLSLQVFYSIRYIYDYHRKNIRHYAFMECLFWTTLVVTFIVTAITVRIPPLGRKPDTYVTEEGFRSLFIKKMLERAWEDALEVSKSARVL